jgi:lysozyme
MTTLLLASKLITVFEGCRLLAYWDPNGKLWTIGFGHTQGVREGMTITMEQAIQFLAEDCAPLLELVKDRPVLEAAALVSFGYNCGKGALQRVLAGEITIEHEEFLAEQYAYGQSSGGKTLAGLAARRALEASLIETSRSL